MNDEKKSSLKNFALFFKKNVLNLKTLNKFLFIFAIVLGVLYVAGMNDLSIQGFVLSDLKEQRNKMADENNKLELKAMTLGSYNMLSGKIDGLKMIAVGEVDYINGNNGIVAKR